MLGTSKTLNTSNVYNYSEKFKDITMSNQQVNKNIFRACAFNINIWKCNFYNLRDYTRRIIYSRWLRYSPLFYESMKFVLLNFMPVNKVLKKILSIDHHLHKLDLNWVTGFVDAVAKGGGCFSIIIEVSNPFAPRSITSKTTQQQPRTAVVLGTFDGAREPVKSKNFIWNKFTWER
jgi:hypothetical protein